MNKQVQAIRAEIERRIDLYRNTEHRIDPNRIDEDESLLSFIDSLPDENNPEPLRELYGIEEERAYINSLLNRFDKKFPILPTLTGRLLHDFKSFLNKCQQIFGLKFWGNHKVQAGLFEKLTLLWATWGAYHLHELYDKQSISEDVQEEIEGNPQKFPLIPQKDKESLHVSEICKENGDSFTDELEKEIDRYWNEEMPVVTESDLNDIARHFVKWGVEHIKR